MPFVDIAPVLFDEPIITDPQAANVSENYGNWFFNIFRAVSQAIRSLVPVNVQNSAAALPSTSMNVGKLSAGVYLIAYYIRITQPASTSSSVTPSLGWTDGGQGCIVPGPAVTGNAPGTVSSGFVLAHVDSPGVLTYSTAYSSVGGIAMTYNLTIAVFKVPNV